MAQMQTDEIRRGLPFAAEQQLDERLVLAAATGGGFPVDRLAVLHQPAQPIDPLQRVDDEDVAGTGGERLVKMCVGIEQLRR